LQLEEESSMIYEEYIENGGFEKGFDLGRIK